MSYYYDRLSDSAKRMGKSLHQLADDMGIPYSTVKKWKNRNPHDRYKPKINQLLNGQGSYSTQQIEPTVEVHASHDMASQPAAVEYDEDGIPIAFWQQLESVYKDPSHENGEKEWATEANPLRAIIKTIASSIKPKYTLHSPIQHGGTSVVIRVHNNELNITRALKFPRPIADRQDLFIDVVKSEISHLMEASHQNIIEIYDQGRVTYSDRHYPYYIMKYINGATDGLGYFSGTRRNSFDLVSVLKQLVSGIQHLHSLKMLHLDIKPENILISPDGFAVLSDLGSARKLVGDEQDILVIATNST